MAPFSRWPAPLCIWCVALRARGRGRAVAGPFSCLAQAHFTLTCSRHHVPPPIRLSLQAHYDMVSSEEGRFELARRGLNPYLVRLCVGEEPAEVVVQVVQDALAAARAASA